MSSGTRPDFVVVRSGRGQIDAWSIQRLPFDPHGSMAEFRDALRAGLREIAPIGGLRAVYSSSSREFCDAENVLFYNVGLSTVRPLMQDHVAFERSFHVPRAPHDLSGAADHHVRYLATPAPALDHWEMVRETARWTAMLPDRTDRPAPWWWAVRGTLETAPDGGLDGRPFGLLVKISGTTRPLSSLLKPMLDGIIAAAQRDPSPSADAVGRVAAELGASVDDVLRLLTDGRAPLGGGTLIRCSRSGVAWNPADDRCVACVVEVSDGPPRISGQVLEVTVR